MLRLLSFSLINNLSRFQKDSVAECFHDEYRVSPDFMFTFYFCLTSRDSIAFTYITHCAYHKTAKILDYPIALGSPITRFRVDRDPCISQTKCVRVSSHKRRGRDVSVSHAIAITLSRRNLISLAYTFVPTPSLALFAESRQDCPGKGQRWRGKSAQKRR